MRSAITAAPERLILYAFDLMMLNGRDLRGLALTERRKHLQDLVGHHPESRIHFSEDLVGDQLSQRSTWPRNLHKNDTAEDEKEADQPERIGRLPRHAEKAELVNSCRSRKLGGKDEGYEVARAETGNNDRGRKHVEGDKQTRTVSTQRS